jgi:putative ABC transport system permease protein
MARYQQTQAPPTAKVVDGQAFQRAPDELPPVVVLAYALWERRFGGRPDIIGRVVRLNGHAVEVVGVLPADFALGEVPDWGMADCWIPAAADPRQRKARYLSAIGRLSPGLTVRQAQAELDVIGQQLAARYPESNKDHGARVVSWLEAQTAGVRTELWLLFGAAVCVLLIAAANVANLCIGHVAGRRLELATRLALGASAAQLVRQTLTESLILAAVGGAAGMALAYWALPVLVALAPLGVPRLDAVRLDGWTLVFASIASVTVGLGCGLAVVFSLNHANPRPGALRPSGADAGSHGLRFRRALSVVQIAVALILIIASGLLVRTLRALASQELGFDPRHVISIGIAPDAHRYVGRADLGYPDAMNAIGRFQTELVARLHASGGVIAAGIGSRPLGGGGVTLLVGSETGEEHRVAVDVVSGGYLEALGVRLITGRFFDPNDTASAPRVAVINQSAAQLLAVTSNPTGHTFRLNREDVRIIGVVGDTRRGTLEQPPGPAIYLSHLQPSPILINNLLIRTVGDPREALTVVRSVMRQLDPDQPLTRIGTLEERIDELLGPRRFMLRLIGLFSAVAFALALIGVYGVIAESVAQRVAEIGIRMALGATPASVRNLFVAQGAVLAGVGSAVGLAGAFAFRNGMSSVVFGVPTMDPLTYLVAFMCLAGATVTACTIPAWRAASLDPVVALRND